MCGIFGFIGPDHLDSKSARTLVKHAQQRGRDSSGMVIHAADAYKAYRADYPIDRLLKRIPPLGNLFFGHSRLVTNSTGDNQPVTREQIIVLHNGIIVNHEAIWPLLGKRPELEIDTEVIPAIIASHLDEGGTIETAAERVLSLTKGVVATAALIPRLGKLLLFSNNGSLYVGDKSRGIVFSSERYPLEEIGAENIRQVRGEAVIVDVPKQEEQVGVTEWADRSIDLVPEPRSSQAWRRNSSSSRSRTSAGAPNASFRKPCRIIAFDADGVCNYCHNYKPRNHPRPKEELFELIEPFRRKNGDEVLVPFSGGRDSCYGLHLIVNELKLRPVTYTYDWGMVTDLGRSNVSRMSCASSASRTSSSPPTSPRSATTSAATSTPG